MAKPNEAQESAREAIIETSIRLFTENGIHSTSLADIAKAASISKGTLYYHYPAKEHLVLDIADYHLGRITDILFGWLDDIARNQDTTDAIRLLFDRLVENDDMIKLHSVLCVEATLLDNNLKKRISSKYREWAVMLEVGSLRMNSEASAGIRRNSKLFFMLVDGYAMQKMLGGEMIDRDNIIDMLIQG